MLTNGVVGFLVGIVSSAVVSIVFYRLSKRDAESLHREALLDSISLKLRELDPRSWKDNYRGHYGADNMIHYLTCMSEIMEEVGFTAGQGVLLKIVSELRQVCATENAPSSLTSEEAENRKQAWYGRIYELRNIQPRSLLNCRRHK